VHWDVVAKIKINVVAKIKINVVAIGHVPRMHHNINAIKTMAMLIIINSKTMAIMVITRIINNNSHHEFVNIRYFLNVAYFLLFKI